MVLVRLALRLGRAEAYRRALDLSTNSSIPEEERIRLIEVLGQAGNRACVPTRLKLPVEDVDLVSGLERAERAGARADRIDQERELARRREAEAHRPRQQPARRLEHEELARPAGVEPAAP